MTGNHEETILDAYEPPQVVTIGSLAELTKGDQVAGTDGGTLSVA